MVRGQFYPYLGGQYMMLVHGWEFVNNMMFWGRSYNAFLYIDGKDNIRDSRQSKFTDLNTAIFITSVSNVIFAEFQELRKSTLTPHH